MAPFTNGALAPLFIGDISISSLASDAGEPHDEHIHIPTEYDGSSSSYEGYSSVLAFVAA